MTSDSRAVDRLRAEIAFAQDRGGEAPLLLLRAARQLETLDVRLSRDTYLDAWAAALFAGRLAVAGGTLLDVSRAVERRRDRGAPRPSARSSPRGSGPGLHPGTSSRGAHVESCGGGVRRATTRTPRKSCAGDGWPLAQPTWSGTTTGRWRSLRPLFELARDAGALEALAVVDNACGQAAAFGGDFAHAAMLMAEVETLKEATSTSIAPHAALVLAGMRGAEPAASDLIGRVVGRATVNGQGTAVQYARWAGAVLGNGLGRYEEAFEAASEASEQVPELYIASWALVELVEAASRTDQHAIASDALRRLAEHTEGCTTDWALGVHARAARPAP